MQHDEQRFSVNTSYLNLNQTMKTNIEEVSAKKSNPVSQSLHINFDETQIDLNE